MNKTVEICYRDKAANDAIVAWDAGMSKDEVAKMLKKHPTWYQSSVKMTDVENMIRSGALNVKWDNWFFAGGRDWGDQDTYFLLRDGKEVGILQDNHDHGITIELDGVRICDELNEDDLVENMEEALAMALRRDDEELMSALGIDDYTTFYLPREYGDISREDVLEGRWKQEE